MRALSFIVAAAALACFSAQAAELKQTKPIAPGIAAFPHLVEPPGDKAARTINRALAGADASVDGVASDCKHYKGWKRTVRVAMRGPKYLSLIANDDWYCGGAYPDTATTALVFDLATGAPVDWKALFPVGLIGEAAVRPGGGVSDPILVDSKPLWELYAKLAAESGPADCGDVLADPGGRDARLQIWPDAAGDGIGLMATELPHAVKACGPEVVAPAAELRKLGVSAELLDVIDEAHAQKLY
ncbi:MAG TPA: hypothetical protein VFW46_19600 [Stellaceae bacterium]|nr:hypothetical protein [Stellaceae bacterium]